jgi:rhomboid protease GluP
MSDGATVVARSASHERLARDWALVLLAAGIACRIEPRGPEWDVVVSAGDAARAGDALATYDAEDVSPAAPSPPPPAEYGRTWAGVAVVVLLVLAAQWTGTRDMRTALFRAGESHADAVLHGEPWRVVTALTLHADATHLVSNLVSGALVATAVCAAVGPGVGAWLLLGSGAAGNAVTAWLRGGAHRAVGASTAIFGGIGILVGLAVVRRPRRAWVPLAAGLALVGFLGTSERADLLAHAFGFAAGVVGGLAVAPAPLVRSRAAQWLLALAALGAVGACWLLAIEHVPRR